MNASLGVRVALHADSFARTFASAGVGGSALSADRQTAQMTNSPVALDPLKAFQVEPLAPPTLTVVLLASDPLNENPKSPCYRGESTSPLRSWQP